MILKEFIKKLQQYPELMEINIGASGDITSIYGTTSTRYFELVTSKDSWHEGVRWANTKTLNMEADPIPHTPGHWVFVKDTKYSYEKYCVNHQNTQHLDAGLSTLVAEVSEGPHGLSNARLIAAAPELLSMVAALVGLLEDENGHHFVGEAIREGKALWNKASGETWIEHDDNDDLEVKGEQQ